MNDLTLRKTLMSFALTLSLAILIGACSKGPRSAVGLMDTPEHHVKVGNDALDQGKWALAENSFNQALSLKKNFSPALAGMGVVTAYKAKATLSADGNRKFAKEAEEFVDKAMSEAKGDDEERAAHIAGIRIRQLSHFPTDWLKLAESRYTLATRLDKRQEDPLPHFYMARAYRDAFQMGKASDLYRRVLQMDKGKTLEAEREWAVVQKVERAAPGSSVGKIIAFQDSLSRADVAALFISELRLDSLYSRGNTQQFDTGFKAAGGGRQQFETDIHKTVPDATDIDTHPMRETIKLVMRLRVLGLEPDPSHKFYPDAKTSRAEFAIMVEDILVKVTGETKLKTKFIGSASPFPDVRETLPYFNAVQTVVTSGFMEVQDKSRRIFAPLEPVSGADALLAIREFKNQLKKLLR